MCTVPLVINDYTALNSGWQERSCCLAPQRGLALGLSAGFLHAAAILPLRRKPLRASRSKPASLGNPQRLWPPLRIAIKTASPAPNDCSGPPPA